MPDAVLEELPDLAPLVSIASRFVAQSRQAGAGQDFFAMAAVVKTMEDVLESLASDLPPEPTTVFAATLETSMRCQLLPADDPYVKDFDVRLSAEERARIPRHGWIGALWSRALAFSPPGRRDHLLTLGRRWNAWIARHGAAGLQALLDRLTRDHPDLSKFFQPRTTDDLAGSGRNQTAL